MENQEIKKRIEIWLDLHGVKDTGRALEYIKKNTDFLSKSTH